MDEAEGVPPEDSDLAFPARPERFMPQLYGELRALAAQYMRRERRGHMLQTTALVHEVYLRLLGRQGLEIDSTEQCLAVAASMMRRILVDHARRRVTQGKRIPRVSLADVDPGTEAEDTDFLRLDAALERLARVSERRSRVVELRFFGGLSIDEVSRELDLSPRTVDSEWREARDWLAVELSRATGG